MSESVELHFRYTEGEYVSAIRTYMLAKRRITFFVGIASVVTLLGIYFLLTQSGGAAAIAFLVTGAFLFGLQSGEQQEHFEDMLRRKVTA